MFSSIFQLVVFLGFLIFVSLKWYGKMYVENLFNKPLKLNTLTPNEPPEMFEQIRTKIEMNFERQNNKRRFTYSCVAILISLSWIILWVNWRFDLAKGYYIFGAIGLFLILASHLAANLDDEIAEIESRIDINSEQSQATRKRVEQNKQVQKKSTAIGLAILLAINVNWAYQIEKNENSNRAQFANELIREVGNGWCLNNDAKRDGDGGYITFGGWPCIIIGSINPPVFKVEDKIHKACAYISFNQENGLPESDSYEIFFDSQEFCIEKDWGVYSVYGLKDQAYDYVSPKLEELQRKLCTRFRYQLTYEESLNFCFDL